MTTRRIATSQVWNFSVLCENRAYLRISVWLKQRTNWWRGLGVWAFPNQEAKDICVSLVIPMLKGRMGHTIRIYV